MGGGVSVTPPVPNRVFFVCMTYGGSWGQRDAGMQPVIIAPVTWTCVSHLKKNEGYHPKKSREEWGSVPGGAKNTATHIPCVQYWNLYGERKTSKELLAHSQVEIVLSCQFFCLRYLVHLKSL